MKKFFGEFKKFIQRGNVIDLAVGVIIGGAFSAITASLVNDIIMPLITALFAACGLNIGLQGLSVVLNGVDMYAADGVTLNPDAIIWNYGNFIQAILNFLLVAFVLFCIIKAINAANDGVKKGAHKYDPLTKEELIAYRKEGKKSKEILELAQAKQAALDEEKRIADEEAAKNAPKTEAQLLAEIADLLREKQGK